MDVLFAMELKLPLSWLKVTGLNERRKTKFADIHKLYTHCSHFAIKKKDRHAKYTNVTPLMIVRILATIAVSSADKDINQLSAEVTALGTDGAIQVAKDMIGAAYKFKQENVPNVNIRGSVIDAPVYDEEADAFEIPDWQDAFSGPLPPQIRLDADPVVPTIEGGAGGADGGAGGA